ncbi:hypothetical protein ACFWGR_27610 [Streptomyces sp. NPDC060311]|uniref:hypothetical protein n=1 Tax=Streptomyces sp. NPDC060311 TaxID=3347096 RepID=UPI0036570757
MRTRNSPRKIDRHAYLVILDDLDRLMLCAACCGGWTVPRVPVDSGSDFEDAATSFLAEHFGIRDPRYGSTYGVHQTQSGECWEYDNPSISHVFTVRITLEESHSLQLISPAHTPWGIEEVKSRYAAVYPAGIILLASGYLEGWLPDGPISFE